MFCKVYGIKFVSKLLVLVVICLDISKAFDTVVHGLLFEEEIHEAKRTLLLHLSVKVKRITTKKQLKTLTELK